MGSEESYSMVQITQTESRSRLNPSISNSNNNISSQTSNVRGKMQTIEDAIVFEEDEEILSSKGRLSNNYGSQDGNIGSLPTPGTSTSPTASHITSSNNSSKHNTPFIASHFERQRSMSNPNDLVELNPLSDPGNHPPSHFQNEMSPLRFQMRQFLKKYTDFQSNSLANFQKKYRTPLRDRFFCYSSLLGSHNFYLIFLPITPWVGQYHLVIDMIYILAYTIYVSGFFKDYWCLPRPKSPPLHRITLSPYTTREYGAPSSHTANATGMTLLLFWYLNDKTNLSPFYQFILYSIVLIYHFTLVIGRLYCGMHGLLDLISGTIIGIFVFQVRMLLKSIFENFDKSNHYWIPFASLTVGFLLLFKHVRPIDECPCFDDSIAFIGVVGGLEISDWIIQFSGYQLIHATKNNLTFLNIVIRLAIGIPCVVIWKEVLSKPLIYGILERIGVYDDRKERAIIREKANANLVECSGYIGVCIIDIIGRYFVYAGIPPVALLLCPWLFKQAGVL